ncbi:MAG TPA: rhomboid family intramembrane serine protease [Beijerinckiaceae bacterium]|jgi:membrane associated rhomboid family serine protease
MFLPLYDGVPLVHLKAPLVTRALIGGCVVAWLMTSLGMLPVSEQTVAVGFGVIPAVLFGTKTLPASLHFVPEPLTLVTSIFLHGSVLHLAGNMLFLWVFGDNVEDGMGHRRFLVFFLLCGVAAGLAHAAMMPSSTVPLIGASGAIAGVVAAYLILYPRVKLWALFFGRIPLHVPAMWAIGFWIVLNVLGALIAEDDNIGWYAHLGGLAAGAALTPILRRRYDPVLARVEKTQVLG